MKRVMKISLAVFAVFFIYGFLFHAKIQVTAESLLPNPSEVAPSIPMSVSFLEEENTLLFSFFEADIESVTIAPPFFSVSEPGAFSFKISADPSVFSEKTFSISYREDWDAVPQKYTLKTAVPDENGLMFFKNGEIKEGELWIAFANETKSETAFVDEEKDMPGIYLNQSFRIKKGGKMNGSSVTLVRGLGVDNPQNDETREAQPHSRLAAPERAKRTKGTAAGTPFPLAAMEPPTR